MLLLQVEEGINIIVGLVLFRVRVELPVQCGARRAHNVIARALPRLICFDAFAAY